MENRNGKERDLFSTILQSSSSMKLLYCLYYGLLILIYEIKIINQI